jgi:protein phosphatase
MVEDEALGAILQTPAAPERWVERMVGEANRRGGLDNITAVIVRVDNVEAPTADDQTSTQDVAVPQRD